MVSSFACTPFYLHRFLCVILALKLTNKLSQLSSAFALKELRYTSSNVLLDKAGKEEGMGILGSF